MLGGGLIIQVNNVAALEYRSIMWLQEYRQSNTKSVQIISIRQVWLQQEDDQLTLMLL